MQVHLYKYTLHNAYCTAQVPWARHHSYRPFTILSFKWTHNLGGLVPWYYHAGNIAVNAANVVLVQRVSTLCLRGFFSIATLRPLPSEATATFKLWVSKGKALSRMRHRKVAVPCSE